MALLQCHSFKIFVMKLFIYLFSFIFFKTNCIGQTSKTELIYLVKYEYSHQINAKLKSTKVVDLMNLEGYKTKSLFYSSQRQIGYNKYLQDKINQPSFETIQANIASYFLNAESQIIEYEYNNKQFKIFDKLSSSSEFNCIDSFKIPVWKIMEDTMKFIGQDCQKATTNFRGRKYTAWFSTKIPISVGPYKFVGLPGLILKISDDDNQFNFECTELNQKVSKKPIFSLYKNSKKITFKKLKELQKLRIENKKLFMQMEYPNVTGTRGDGSIIEDNKKIALAPYNPIEITP